MSIDVYVWAAACSIALPSGLPDAENWNEYTSPWNIDAPDRPWWQYEGKNWAVSVKTLDRSEAPLTVKLRLRKQIEGYSIVQEGGTNSEEAMLFVESTLIAITKNCKKFALDDPSGISWFKN